MSFLRERDAEPIPGYRLIEPIGSGGFGEAWKCEAPGGLFKAIKFVFGNMNSLDMEGARAEQELHALQRIKEVRHPFVLSLDRIEVVEGELVIVMELADKSLHDIYVECQAAGLIGVPRDDLLRYMRDAAEALDHMNEKHNLQHLDVKPRNLFVVCDRVKVADFGLVKHLERQSASGLLGGVTPLYAAPETFTGKISPQSDQYSLAVVYQEMLTGQRPFTGKNARQLAQQHLQELPELRGLPEPERPVVARALAKDPGKRFHNCLAFIRALYTVRTTRAEPLGLPEPGISVPGQLRSKSMAETLENFKLEGGGLAASVIGNDEESKESWSPDDEVNLAGATAAERKSLEEVSNLGITVAQPQTGALRPTLILGIGSLARRAMLDLRCRFVDRFGDLNNIPMLRFLYVDSDSEEVRASIRGAPEVALKTNEVYHLPLQSVSHYRRRQLEHLSDWLPREKLYAMPRALKTQGSRALGRLAFTDNYHRLLARVKREIQQCAHPDVLYHSVNQTGLALRDNTPRIFVIAAAGGGGSGLLVDLGYNLRRLLQQLRYPTSSVVTMLLCGAPEDPATPVEEQANVFATLTELNHYTDGAVPFSAQYGADGPQIADSSAPFDSVYLLVQPTRTPDARRDMTAHLCSYLFHELTTPLGLQLENDRKQPNASLTPFRSLGTHTVWFPRGLLLRLAAREACKRLFEEWQVSGEPNARAEIDGTCARVLADPILRPEVIAAQVEDTAATAIEGKPGEALSRMLAAFEEQIMDYPAQDDPGAWAKQVLLKVHEWLGTGLGSQRETGEWRKSKLSRSLETAIQRIAAELDQRLADSVLTLTEHPGRRLAAAEAAINRLMLFCDEQAAGLSQQLDQLQRRVNNAQSLLQGSVEACVTGTGGFSLFGGKPKRLLRIFLDCLSAFARQCLEEDLGIAIRMVFSSLRGRLGDRLRDLAFCRQRLRHMQETLEQPMMTVDEMAETPLPVEITPTPGSPASPESFWESIRQSNTTRVVLPADEEDLEKAAFSFLAKLKPESWTLLDQNLQDTVLAQQGGLYRACTDPTDHIRHLLAPLVDQAALYLGEHLPITDVAQVEACDSAQASNVQVYFDNAAPSVTSMQTDNSGAYLLTPVSDPGKNYGSVARDIIPNLHVIRVPGQADLMFCREQGYLNLDELDRIFKPCRKAYGELSVVVNASPHARFDVTDWVPLTP
ncbi:MAG TPA: tubulin-like doman-containing protein [Gemmataceae bacterium]|nr:tubulin-like doman-containing protein [Gemmataceae bacterium]